MTPGPIDTPILDKVFSDKATADHIREQMSGMVPMKRFGTAEEIAKAVLFLAFDDLHDRRRTPGRWGLVATLTWGRGGRAAGED